MNSVVARTNIPIERLIREMNAPFKPHPNTPLICSDMPVPYARRKSAETDRDMVHLTHSAIHWQQRCIEDTSSDKNTPPNVLAARQCIDNRHESDDNDLSSTGTDNAPWTMPEQASCLFTPMNKSPPATTEDPRVLQSYDVVTRASGIAAKTFAAEEDGQDPSVPTTRTHRAPFSCFPAAGLP
ncbi:hypothetical protein F443_05875 [Phytophthora nicotianae P1569]|uniref:Uncharacterized protein n=1 Tax=Phytophthora nicotianae P1569 TaxID=1317065 RepID=V9FJN3_PHYNI|nr:hypothetical protein F443_05875 [Phytophthora nicotianae P1569]